jgi:hypothetical protein
MLAFSPRIFLLLLVPMTAICFGSELRIDAGPPVKADATIPWLANDDASWQNAPPTFVVPPASNGVWARGWLASTDTDLLLRVDVRKKNHINTQTGGNIWNGDFLRVNIDGKGDGTAGGAPDASGTFGPDDASIGFALTPTGPQGWVSSSGDSQYLGAYPADLLNFTRDETAGITRYVIRLPWSRFHVQPGVFPTFGIVVQIRSIDTPDQKEPVHIRWGDGADDRRPGLYRKVALSNPPHELIAAAPGASEIWERGDRGAIAVAIASADSVTIHASAGGQTLDREVPGDAGLAVHRFQVTFDPTQAAEHILSATVTKTGSPQPTTRASNDLLIADPIAQQLCDRLDQLISQAGHPLFLRHLRSVKAMVQAEWSRATLYKKTNPALARETLDYLQNLLAGFNGDSANWQSYLNDGLPLFMAYISPRDGTLQWYTLTLPQGWDPTKARDDQPAFPLYFELHGAGNPHYLNNAAGQLGKGHTGSGLLGYERPQTYAQIARKGYHVLPFGRGNSGYRDIGETDVWEAYDDAGKTVKIDPDRRYLYGFSMGGGGTWNLGSRTPDRWAAIAILGMGVQAGAWGQAQNVANLPVFVWGGEADPIAYRDGAPKEIITRFADALRKAGGTVQASSTPGLGHNYSGDVQKQSYDWLSQYTRRRPQHFSFVADTSEHRGVWGITMDRDLQISALPRFECLIDGQTVRISTSGTPRLTVDTGSDGLQLNGSITIEVNGQPEFKGEAPDKPLKLEVPPA